MKHHLTWGALSCALLFLTFPTLVGAHGFEGDRFFPPTIQTDDPFATDELAVPTIQYNPANASRETDINASFTKEVFPKFALSLSETYINLNPKGGPAKDGIDNLSLGLKYQLWEMPEHEFIFSIGSDFDLGGTGSKSLGVDSFTTCTPTVYFGKGWNELPEQLKFLRPFALTAQVGLSIPGESANADGSLNSDTLQWGGALEYSLPYLQEHVQDIGLPRPFRDLIPLVEFSLSSPLNRSGGTTTGTIDPGILWEGKYCQIGAEAVIPFNDHSGPSIGAVFQVQIYIDDLFPKLFGHPLFFNQDNDK